jgi:pilus assembly protein CpaF
MFGQKLVRTSATMDDSAAAEAVAVLEAAAAPAAVPIPAPGGNETLVRSELFKTIRTGVFSLMNASAAVGRTREQMKLGVEQLVVEIAEREHLNITIAEQVYVERHGRLELTPFKFRDNTHVINVAQRIAAGVGRRVDESSPMVDARLADGSRVNVVLPPLAIHGATISIRKFSKRNITLHRMAQQGNMSQQMANLLKLASTCRLNIIVSGGTGSGKTTLLNALSHFIGLGERTITIEDAAELQLVQPHVVSLETRPENAEGLGGVAQRDLVRNALRMRPDRIILGETRGPEAFDVLQAMNTGHDGSMTTIHANTPRDGITRLESMVMMANGNLPLLSIRRQIASAVHLIVQIERMRDGMRRVTRITELVGMEGDVIITQDLFTFRYDATAYSEEVKGVYESALVRPAFSARAAYYGLEDALLEAMRP